MNAKKFLKSRPENGTCVRVTELPRLAITPYTEYPMYAVVAQNRSKKKNLVIVSCKNGNIDFRLIAPQWIIELGADKFEIDPAPIGDTRRNRLVLQDWLPHISSSLDGYSFMF